MTCPFELFPFLFQVRASQEFPGSLWYTAVVSGQSATNGWQLLHCAHHYKSCCIENYWCDYQGCYSCASINKYSTSKRHSRINSKGTALCETKIASCRALKVPSADCHVPAVTSQGPCLPLKCKKHMWLQKPWGYSLSLQDSDTEKLEPTYKYTFEYQCSISGSQNLPTFSELWRSQANSSRMGSSLFLPPLQPWGLFSSSLSQGLIWGFCHALYPQRRFTDEANDLKHTKGPSHWEAEAWQKDLG